MIKCQCSALYPHWHEPEKCIDKGKYSVKGDERLFCEDCVNYYKYTNRSDWDWVPGFKKHNQLVFDKIAKKYSQFKMKITKTCDKCGGHIEMTSWFEKEKRYLFHCEKCRTEYKIKYIPDEK